jgi:phosphohistidine phosphatase
VKQLLLLRHAEAEPAPPGAKDFDRLLTARGRLEALAAAETLAAAHLTIDEILVSPARRARETADIFARRLKLAIAPGVVAELYLAPPDVMLGILEHCSVTSDTILLIGHNPGISELAHQLHAGSDSSGLRTAGLCQLTFAHDRWQGIGGQRASGYRLLR